MDVTSQVEKRKAQYLYIALFWLCTVTVLFSKDAIVWMMEVLPAYIGFVVIFVLLDKGIRFSRLLNVIFPLEILVLTIGGVFTYSEVPFFNPTDWLGETFGWERNNYDKLGHFMQGVTPYLATKELLIRRRMVKRSPMQVFLCISVSMAISAIYELFEYMTTMMSGDFAESFVASQGDPFDTQKDMLFALIGAVFAACASLTYRYEEEKNEGES